MSKMPETSFEKPVVKQSREIKTHLREKTNIEKIFCAASLHSNRRSMFRMIIGLPQKELENNIYLLADIMLKTIIEDSTIDRMFYKAFAKIIEAEKAYSIQNLCVDYLKAQLSFDGKYLSLAEVLIRHFKGTIIERRAELLEIIENSALKQKIIGLKSNKARQIFDSADSIYFIRSGK